MDVPSPGEILAYKTAVTAMAAAVVFLFGLYVKEQMDCKKDRVDIRKELEKVKLRLGFLRGQVSTYRRLLKLKGVSLGPEDMTEADADDQEPA